jgi:hypothetical protein
MSPRRWLFPVFLALLLPVALGAVGLVWSVRADLPADHVYLTWRGDPLTTMVVHYHTDAPDPSVVSYGDREAGGAHTAYPHRVEGTSRKVVDRHVHTVELTGLTPGATYYFTVGTGEPARQAEHHFQMPPAEGPIRFALGGDMGTDAIVGTLIAAAAARDPHFIVVGGDIAYANGDPQNVELWDQWFAHWTRHARTRDGALLPIIAGIGNHEVNKREGTPEDRAPMYLPFFEQGGLPYFTRRFGDRLAIVVLDTGHLYPHAAQADWLAEQLEATAGVAFQVPVYHVPLYPSNRAWLGPESIAGRTHWLPLFDAHRVPVAFEHHDHLYKRTKPMRDNAVTDVGTVYLGDGCFGRRERAAVNSGAWYMERAESRSHFWVVDVDGDTMRCQALDASGAVFDDITFPAPSRGDALADAA